MQSVRSFCWCGSLSRFIFTIITATKLINQIHRFLRSWCWCWAHPDNWGKKSRYLTEALNERIIKIGKTKKNLNITHKVWFRSILYDIYPLLFHLDSLSWHNVLWEANLALLKMTLLEVGKKAVFPQFLENLLNRIDVSLVLVLVVEKDVIKVNNDKMSSFLTRILLI